MAVTWDIAELEAIKTVGSLSNVVTTVHWTARDSETVSGVEHYGYNFGSISLADPDSSIIHSQSTQTIESGSWGNITQSNFNQT